MARVIRHEREDIVLVFRRVFGSADGAGGIPDPGFEGFGFLGSGHGGNGSGLVPGNHWPVAVTVGYGMV